MTNEKSLALTLISPPAPASKNQGETYLKFQLTHKTPAVLAMSQAQEVIVLSPARLTPMPNMPPHVLGLMNRRSRVLWVIDLALMLGLSSTPVPIHQYNIIILRNQSFSLGAVVQSVASVVRLTANTISPPPGQISSNLLPYLRGCSLLEKELLLVLDGEGIIANVS
jgi:twitching motility protein PilI